MTASVEFSSRDAIHALNPLLIAERERGNSAHLDLGNMHDRRMYFQFRHPVDLDALEAQFEFGNGVVLGPGGPGATGTVVFNGLGGLAAFWLQGGTDGDTWWSRRRHAAWWRRWTANPLEPVPFANPFANLPS